MGDAVQATALKKQMVVRDDFRNLFVLALTLPLQRSGPSNGHSEDGLDPRGWPSAVLQSLYSPALASKCD